MDIDYKAMLENNNKYIDSVNQKNTKLYEEIIYLESENHDLKEQLKYFIPRRRVRRVYKMLSKILNQMDYNDGTSNEEADERDIIEKQRKMIYKMAEFIKLSTNNSTDTIENIINNFERKIKNDNSSCN